MDFWIVFVSAREGLCGVAHVSGVVFEASDVDADLFVGVVCSELSIASAGVGPIEDDKVL